ncbi:Predicted flavoprotein CzcO associated with the cation diffusion facilitator CzcD [Fontimonas thermophila]|uniref:Predicted flavoprotein CzcO associated with the cation diffusion facilitator CzcD n=1 Tax=Fontimonas thermophila TaxID=1076937 RepID=A0A1I2H995_9GAMM|nr:NAD(P)/FAD-dependent oxidoreductase [Fontimonas thermophila]SFF26138.1 Predicted flavoprotein CzcO associated with the cation diffusion facilitator CzcD [Fontimonas thermophila]
MSLEYVDVLIVGAGLSGIGAAVHLQNDCPQKTYAIFEARDTIGGTWDLFRYPGIRSDSDMYTLGYRFRPWTQAKAIADGPSILDYVRQTAREHGIERHIRFRHRVVRASWSSADARWTVEAERGPDREIVRIACNFLYLCAGYYNYERGYTPDFAGVQDFKGRIVHPQHWPEDLDYSGKRVVVIGSGATAVTLVPAMAETAAHVTMLQRSPSYVMSLPSRDLIADALRRVLPSKAAYALVRWKNVLLSILFFQLSRRYPELVKKLLRKGVRTALGRDFDVDTHFKPRYNPWDQRVCFVPDADLFKAIRCGRASIVTDHIERFTDSGIRLASGKELKADIIVTATGLELKLLGGTELIVDGQRIDLSKTLTYKGMMCSGVPNMAFAIGYTNASWTLKCDLTSAYLCRLLNHMDRMGYRQCTPRNTDPSVTELPLIDFSSGYVQRAIDRFPKQGSKTPWRLHQNYVRDLLALRYGPVDDAAMEFSRPAPLIEPARSAA